MNDKLFVIAPFSRPKFAQNLLDNFNRQKYQNKELIIIENNKGIGVFDKRFNILKSKPSAGAAKNKGLLYLKSKYDNVMWTTFDDDDYYGENHLDEVAQTLQSKKAQICGRYSTFMRSPIYGDLFLDYKMENCYTNTVFGYSISAWSAESNLFPDTSLGEDNDWLKSMRQSGAKIWAMSRYNSSIVRYELGHHNWKIHDSQIILSTNRNAKRIISDDFFGTINKKHPFMMKDLLWTKISVDYLNHQAEKEQNENNK